jgi:tetraprenyl-beta-curcumene synthase
VAREVRRQRVHARNIPDGALRRVALHALESKRRNLEGAAAFAVLVNRTRQPAVIKALTVCQAICDYLDLLAEQPSRDPVANGRQLHEALLVAIAPGRSHGDYYRHCEHSNDGGYLQTLIEMVHEALLELPSLALIAKPLRCAAGRIAAYQSLNHGDHLGSYKSFEQWASWETLPATGLRWWETGAGAGSTLSLYVLIAAAADPCLERSDVMAIESAYFPWIGALHSLLDSLADREEDIATGERGLIDCYASAVDAATRMQMIACEALQRAEMLTRGRRHVLIVAAMTSFYICEMRKSPSMHAQLVAPAVLQAIGGLATPTMPILGARRLAGCILAPSAPRQIGRAPTALRTSQVVAGTRAAQRAS